MSAIASQRVFRVLRQFVGDWRYSERKLGLKEVRDEMQEADEEVVGMGDWLAEADDEDEGEVETMSMADFLGGSEDDAVREAEDEDEDEQSDGRIEHRIDVGRAAERKDARPAVVKASKLDEVYDEDEAEDELDEVRLDDLDLDDGDDELQLSPSKPTTK